METVVWRRLGAEGGGGLPVDSNDARRKGLRKKNADRTCVFTKAEILAGGKRGDWTRNRSPLRPSLPRSSSGRSSEGNVVERNKDTPRAGV